MGGIRPASERHNETMKRSLRTPLIALVASLALAGTAHAPGATMCSRAGARKPRRPCGPP